MKRSKITLSNVQFKSLAICKKVARGIDLIEEHSGIHNVRITIENPFICPEINLDKLNKSPIEILLRDILKKIVNPKPKEKNVKGNN